MATVFLNIGEGLIIPELFLEFSDNTRATKTITSASYDVNIKTEVDEQNPQNKQFATFYWQKKIGTGAWVDFNSTTVKTNTDKLEVTNTVSYRVRGRLSTGEYSNYSNELKVIFTKSIGAPKAVITITTAPEDTRYFKGIKLDFNSNSSTADPSDPIVSRSWRASVTNEQGTNTNVPVTTPTTATCAINSIPVGDITLFLTVVTQSGQTNSTSKLIKAYTKTGIGLSYFAKIPYCATLAFVNGKGTGLYTAELTDLVQGNKYKFSIVLESDALTEVVVVSGPREFIAGSQPDVNLNFTLKFNTGPTGSKIFRISTRLEDISENAYPGNSSNFRQNYDNTDLGDLDAVPVCE